MIEKQPKTRLVPLAIVGVCFAVGSYFMGLAKAQVSDISAIPLVRSWDYAYFETIPSGQEVLVVEGAGVLHAVYAWRGYLLEITNGPSVDGDTIAKFDPDGTFAPPGRWRLTALDIAFDNGLYVRAASSGGIEAVTVLYRSTG